MNKQELVSNISSKTGATKKDVEAIINSFTEVVAEALADGEKVQLIGFGTFEVRQRAERQGRNPSTGESLVIPATTVPAFKAGAKLKEAVKD